MIEPMPSRNVSKAAFATRILADGQVWMDMLDHRNLLAHTYDEQTFDQAVLAIRARSLEAIEQVHRWLDRHPAVTGALLFGSRVKGTAHSASDINFALEGLIDPLQAAAIAAELEELPLPSHFDVQALAAIHQPLREHILRVGVRIEEKGPAPTSAETGV